MKRHNISYLRSAPFILMSLPPMSACFMPFQASFTLLLPPLPLPFNLFFCHTRAAARDLLILIPIRALNLVRI